MAGQLNHESFAEMQMSQSTTKDDWEVSTFSEWESAPNGYSSGGGTSGTHADGATGAGGSPEGLVADGTRSSPRLPHAASPST